MNKVYLIVDRYDRGEFYNIYGKGIYTNLDEAKKDWEDAVKSFLSIGPDDVYLLSLVECNLDDAKLKELENHISKLNTIDGYNYDEDYTKFMDENVNVYEAIYGPEGYDSVCEIQDAIEDDGKDWEDEKVFKRYLNKYYKKYYS